ncbi:HET-domain-containing protein, partial [Lizonia empirigonia]
MLLTWIEQCIHQHELCHVKLSDTQPARLLDLNPFPASKDIRLVHTRDTDVEAYATLSYCWGSMNPLVLKKENYELLKSQIQLEDLPRTVQEAIEVCRALSMRYLWVDALCIIQEGGEDFAREVANMGAIYAGSLFTVAAADSTDAEDYFTHVHDSKQTLLSRRGWVLQEQMMSPRTIHFTSEEIVWECREQKFCKVCRHGNNETEWYSRKKGVDLSANMPSRKSGTELTNIDDRLSALAGIAQFAHEELHYKASYGLWLDSFIEELSWFTWNPDTRFEEISGQTPSWSWVS